MTRQRQITATVAAILLAIVSACGTDEPETGTDGSHTGPEALGHVHGLGTDPADGTLYAATHFGVFNLGREGAGPAKRVADRWQDTMAFTVVGPNHFLASGHPDQREDLPVHLGLIETIDAGETWQPVSLLGEADFHALEAAGGLLYGYDSISGQLMVSPDHENWRTLDAVEMVDLAADPQNPARVFVATANGVMAYRADGGSSRPITGAPPLVLLDWPTVELLVGVAADGTVNRSSNAGDTWQRSDGPPGDLQALDVSPEGWHLATSAGIFRSTDDGRTWKPLPGQ